ncbi:MAG TPA: hypothetical protein VGO59_04210 [Verrucomicrobiae bacterium]|jgi:hypothetical protein
MKSAAVIVATGCLVAWDMAARADSFVSFSFTADPGQPTVLNGSTFTVNEFDNSVVAWDIIDFTSVPSIGSDIGFGLDSAFSAGSHNDILSAPGAILNPTITSTSSDGFAGTFAAFSFVYPQGFLDFITPNSLSDEFVLWPAVNDGDLPLIIGHNIPGTWTDPRTPAVAPDAANTFTLLLAGAGAAGILRHRRG